MTAYLVRVSVSSVVEADCAEDAIATLADKIDTMIGRDFATVLTHEHDCGIGSDDLTVEFCPYSNCRCPLPHGLRSRRLSRYADACEAEESTEPDLTAKSRDPMREVAIRKITRQRKKTA